MRKSEWRTMRVVGCLFALAIGFAPGCGRPEPVDLLITGGTIHTMNPERPQAEAVGILGNRIVFVGDRDESSRFQGPRTLVLDIGGLTMMPGLVDAHAHLMNLGRYLTELRLIGTSSADDVRQMVLSGQAQAKPGEWILGRGWDQNDWEIQEFPTWADLEGTEANPVFLKRVGGHAAWLNATALEVLGIAADTPDPFGGRIHRDEEGNPTGVLIDRAKDDAFEGIPEPAADKKTSLIRLAIEECRRFGLTGVHDAQTRRDELEIYRRLDRATDLGLRIYAMLDTDDSTFVMSELSRGASVAEGSHLTVRAIKVYADGALGSRGAALLAPYADEPTNRGLMKNAPEDIRRWTQLAVQNGFQMCAHAIGDAGNRTIIDIYEEQMQSSPATEHRFRIEHAQVVSGRDITRMAKLGIVASMQPTHATSDMYWAEDRIGPARIEGAYAWRKLMDAGVVVACGSDFPVEAVNPLWGIYSAITRQDHSGWPPDGWYPDERMTIEEAVRGFTMNAAYAEFSEDEKGTIEKGKLADFTVLDRDIFVAPARALLETRAIYTIVDGQVVYAARDSIAWETGSR
jgi:predicted amidohydrolase YtcJ